MTSRTLRKTARKVASTMASRMWKKAVRKVVRKVASGLPLPPSSLSMMGKALGCLEENRDWCE